MNASAAEYRAVSIGAIVSLIVAMMALLAFVHAGFVVIAGLGCVVGGFSMYCVRRYEQAGIRFAVFGFVLSIAVAVTAPAWHWWLFQHEALPGYERLNFSRLIKDGRDSLEQHFGRKVCVKGYIYPQRELEMSRFVLTATGDPNKMDAMIIVSLPVGESWTYDDRAIAVSGVLAPNPAAKRDDKQPKYLLNGAAVRYNSTLIDWAARTHSNGC